ncbi:MAG: hypothetical protein ABIG66_03415 [Candidatus Kerfeldbacteria bacterium]
MEEQINAKQNRSRLIILLPIAVLVIVLLGAVIVPRFFGYRFDVGYARVDIQQYQNESPALSFEYDAEMMAIDTDEEQRYGDTYIVGLKANDDPRTGCDVRRIQQTFDLERPVEDVAKELSDELGSGSTSFQSTNSGYIFFKEQKAIGMDINFIGPLGDAAKVRQVFVPDGDYTFTMICGGNKSLQKFYQKEYDRFFNTFSFN